MARICSENMRLFCTVACLVLTIAQQTIATPLKTGPRKKITFEVHDDRANAVRDAFQYAWDGYYKYAWTHDELHPIAKAPGDSRFESACSPPLVHANQCGIETVGVQRLLMLSVLPS